MLIYAWLKLTSKGCDVINSIFVCDDLLRQEIRDVLNIHPIEEIIAEAEGKLFKFGRSVVMMNKKDLRIRENQRVFGSILKFNPESMPDVLRILDSFNSCSISKLSKTQPTDLTYRSYIIAYPISFDSIQKFNNFDYKYKLAIRCLAYMGNQNNKLIWNTVKRRNTRIVVGYYKRGLTDLFIRKGITT